MREGNCNRFSSRPAFLLVHIFRSAPGLAIPLLRLFIGRPTHRANGADGQQEYGPYQGSDHKHQEHTIRRCNGGAGGRVAAPGI